MGKALTRFRKKQEWEAFLEELKLVLQKLDIGYRETSRIRTSGALCTVHGKRVLIVNRHLSPDDKAELVRQELDGMDLEGVFLKPEVREFLSE
ncbi:MAG: hypothetical protein P8Z49_04740 [Acidobacteriota bacterium]|jgi:hypothetical protein